MSVFLLKKRFNIINLSTRGIIHIFPIILLFCTCINTKLFAENNIITVYCNDEFGEINRKIFGNNFIGYDPMTYEYRVKEFFGYSDYGAGIWVPKQNKSIKEVINLAKKVGISLARFPGGCGTHHYNWKNTIGPKRKHFLFGIDEFLETCEEIGSEAVITVSYFTGNEHDAADLVEYLNCLNDGSNTNSGIDWAKKRVKNGRSKPYNVKYFEIGNEVYDGNHQEIKQVVPEEYAYRYLKYYKAMKAIDPKIKIGAVLYTSSWNRRILNIIKKNIDFGIIHTYPGPEGNKNILAEMDAIDTFSITLGLPIIKDDFNFSKTLKLFKEKLGQTIPLAITEYNGGFQKDYQSIPYRHCLGTALLNAELLRIFMKPEHHVLMANYWQFCNSYWGMIANGFNGNINNLNNSYYKRPNYYVYELYNHHFGDILLKADVVCSSYSAENISSFFPDNYLSYLAGTLFNEIPLNKNIWLVNNIFGINAEVNQNNCSIEFVNPRQFNYYHTFMLYEVEPNTFYKLSGYLKSENLLVNEKESGFRLEIQDARGWNKIKWTKTTEDIKGNVNWFYFEKVFKTLPDSKGIRIIARRIGNKPPLKGKVFLKNIQLHKFTPKDYKIPYFSVNASKSKNGNKIYLIVINKNMENDIEVNIILNDFEPEGIAHIYTLWAANVNATNEKKPHNAVKVFNKKIKFNGNSLSVKLKKHSMTAIEINAL